MRRGVVLSQLFTSQPPQPWAPPPWPCGCPLLLPGLIRSRSACPLHRALQHTNLLQCLAQCAEVTPYLLVMEFCPLVSPARPRLPGVHRSGEGTPHWGSVWTPMQHWAPPKPLPDIQGGSALLGFNKHAGLGQDEEATRAAESHSSSLKPAQGPGCRWGE